MLDKKEVVSQKTIEIYDLSPHWELMHGQSKTESGKTENEINQTNRTLDGCSYLPVNHDKVVISLHMKAFENNNT